MTKPLSLYSDRVRKSYRKSNENRWVSALWSYQAVGAYQDSATASIANDMGVSPDTIEDLARAYDMYFSLCSLPGARSYVRTARKLPYIYYSHFRALYEAKKNYKLTDKQVLDLLVDIVQGEGSISTRDVDVHTRERYGDTRDWTYYASKTKKQVRNLLSRPDLPKEGRELLAKSEKWLKENTNEKPKRKHA